MFNRTLLTAPPRPPSHPRSHLHHEPREGAGHPNVAQVGRVDTVHVTEKRRGKHRLGEEGREHRCKRGSEDGGVGFLGSKAEKEKEAGRAIAEKKEQYGPQSREGAGEGGGADGAK